TCRGDDPHVFGMACLHCLPGADFPASPAVTGSVAGPGRTRRAGGMPMISWNARFAIVALLLAGTALFLKALDRHQSVLPRTALASFPVELRSWAGTDIPIPEHTLKR